MRIAQGAVLGLLLAWLAGFAAFAGTVVWLSDRQVAAVDCAVLFTGRHGRALDGVTALRDAPPRRLLISGYGEGMGHRELAELRQLAPEIFSCCVDVEAISRNTAENGQQTALWAAHRGCNAVAVITDDVHMPRAWLELRRRMAEPPIRPVAVGYATQAPIGTAIAAMLREYHRLAAAALLGL